MSDSEPKSSNGSDKLNELRNILFPEREQFDSLQEKFENPDLLAENVSQILPEAVRLRSSRDEDLTRALSPAVEKSLRISVQRNPRPIVDAIFPIIGPAIRRAISTAIAGLVQSLNQTLEYSLSVRGLKWRWEAIRTGKPFAEIVLLHSLLYRVEQIFLIHRESGLLLHHVSAISSQSADLISGMLTAIQDFVRDSFQVQESETLETMRVGDLSVWVEQGPHAILAAVIRGNAPHELRTTFQATLEKIHMQKGRALQKFQGDAAPFESVRPDLEECLLSQYKQAKQKKSPFAWILISVLLIATGIWLSLFWLQKQRVNRLVDRLNAEPGIAITSLQKKGGMYHFSGLRDPLAANPEPWVRESHLDPERVTFHWEPYQAMHPQFVLARAKNLLNPPQTVSLSLHNGVLAGKGSAKHSWIAESRVLVRALQGIDRYDDVEIMEIEAGQMSVLKKNIESYVFRFLIGSADLVPGQEQNLEVMTRDLLSLVSSGAQLKKNVVVETRGHTDTSGDEVGNIQLSQSRADYLIRYFIAQGVAPDIFVAIAKASDEPLRPEQSEQDREWNRSVTFRVVWDNPENEP